MLPTKCKMSSWGSLNSDYMQRMSVELQKI